MYYLRKDIIKLFKNSFKRSLTISDISKEMSQQEFFPWSILICHIDGIIV